MPNQIKMPGKKSPAKAFFSLLVYRVPGFVLLCFKRAKSHINLDLVLAFEIIWYSPRVPADITSPILKSAGINNISRLVYNPKYRWGYS
jgi:hypothetical protein